MRIASLLPSATEIICALGLADSLIGVSHECDYPAEAVAGLPRLTRSAIPAGLSSSETDAAVSARLRSGEGLYIVEEELLADLKPDLLITQELCDVCAVSFSQVQQLAGRLPGQPKIISLTPPNLAGIFEDICTVATSTGHAGRGEALNASLKARLEKVSQAAAGQPRPRVFALEWLDLPFAAGHWVPEMIALAGGHEVLGRPGEKSFRVTWEHIIAAQPEIMLLIPCGCSAESARQEFDNLPRPSGWETIPAVKTGQVHALNANSYFSRPAPRCIEGIEILAKVFQLVTLL